MTAQNNSVFVKNWCSLRIKIKYILLSLDQYLVVFRSINGHNSMHQLNKSGSRESKKRGRSLLNDFVRMQKKGERKRSKKYVEGEKTNLCRPPV